MDILTQLGISHSEGNFLLIFDGVEQARETSRNLSLNDGGDFLDSSGSTIEFLEGLQLQPIRYVRNLVRQVFYMNISIEAKWSSNFLRTEFF